MGLSDPTKRTDRLRLRDARRMLRLLYGTPQLDDEPLLWPASLLRRLCTLVGAHSGTAVFHKVPYQDNEVPTAHEMNPTVARLALSPPYALTPAPWTLTPAEIAGALAHTVTTITTFEQLISLNGRRDKPGTGSSCLFSTTTLIKRPVASRIALLRSGGAPPFGERERKLLHLFHAELRRRVRPAVAPAVDPSSVGLPPRLVQVLASLQTGMTQKEIARSLGLSYYTVHNYTRSIYRRLEVNSRAELHAKLHGQGKPTRRRRRRPAPEHD